MWRSNQLHITKRDFLFFKINIILKFKSKFIYFQKQLIYCSDSGL
jgi:hypothetical protein